MANRNRMGTQGATGYGATNAANRRNSAYEFSTELGGNTPGAVPAGGYGAGGAGQAGRVGTNRTRTTTNLRGQYR